MRFQKYPDTYERGLCIRACSYILAPIVTFSLQDERVMLFIMLRLENIDKHFWKLLERD